MLRADEAELVVAEHPGAGTAVTAARERERGRVLHDGDARVGRNACDQRLRDGGPGGGAVGVQDPAAAVAALAAEAVGAVVAAVKAHAHALEVADAVDALLGQQAHGGGIAQAAADRERVGGMLLERVAGPDRRGHSALGHVGVGCLQRALGDQGHPCAQLGSAQGRVEAGKARTQHEHVGADGGGGGHRRAY